MDLGPLFADLGPLLASRRSAPRPPLGCRLWSGATGTRGYPVARVNGKLRQVRRLVYVRDKRPLRSGEMVVMECGERLCLEPAHMSAKPR